MIAAAPPEVAVIPQVFANTDAQAATIKLQNLGAMRRLEVAVLVEYVVSWQQGLIKYRPHGAVLQQRGAIEQRAPHFRRIGGGDTDQ